MNKKFLFACMALAAMTSCTNVELNEKTPSGGNSGNMDTENPWGEGEIVLSSPRVNVIPAGAQTRAPFEGTINPGNPLLARVAATTSRGYYGDLYVDGTMNFTNSHQVTSFEPGFTGSNYYPSQGRIYIFGLYPTESSSCGVCPPDGGTGTPGVWTVEASYQDRWEFEFGGSDDVMVAPEMEATKENTGELAPALTFQHLLTRLNIYMKASNADVPERWGQITGITLTGVQGNQPNTSVSVSLRDNPVRPEYSMPVSSFKCFKASGSGNTITYSDVVYNEQRYDLTTSFVLQAYTLMAPATLKAGDTIKLRVTMEGGTDNGTSREVEVQLKNQDATDFVGDTTGKSFDIRLSFTANEINATAEVIDWVDGGDGDVEID